MKIRETYVNRDLNNDNEYIYGGNEYKPFTENRGRLFLLLQKEYGRCTSKMYIDLKDGSTKAIGWVFARKTQYTDSPDFYYQEVWVEIVEE